MTQLISILTSQQDGIVLISVPVLFSVGTGVPQWDDLMEQHLSKVTR